MKAEDFLRKPSGPYDIIFLDPPYADPLQPLLDRIGSSDLLAKDGLVIAEHFKKQPSPSNVGALCLQRETCYGDTVLAFYRMEQPASRR